ncbi:MAG: hypothetical protein V1872_02440 [bacterium]
MQKIWIRKAKSYKEVEEFDREYYLKMDAKERLEIVQALREMHFKMKKNSPKDEDREGLRRVIKVVKQK